MENINTVLLTRYLEAWCFFLFTFQKKYFLTEKLQWIKIWNFYLYNENERVENSKYEFSPYFWNSNMKITTPSMIFEIQIWKSPHLRLCKKGHYEHSFQGKLGHYEMKFTTPYIIVIKSSIRALNSIRGRGLG